MSDDDDDFQTTDEPTENPKDPAMLAASEMVRQAMETPGDDASGCNRNGSVVIVITKRAEWAPCIAAAVCNAMPWTRRRRDYVPEEIFTTAMSSAYGNGVIVVDCVSKEGSSHGLETAVWSGRGCVAVATDLNAVPQSVRDACDATLMVREADAGALSAASENCICGPQEWPWEDVPGAVTPRLLRAAYLNGRPAAEAHERARKLMLTVSARPDQSTAPVWSLDRLHGMPEISAWGRSLALDVEAWRRGELQWEALDPGAMLEGPPGTGKTTVAKAIASHCRLRFLATSYADWESGKGGSDWMLSKRMRAVFHEAAKEPTLLFIDELDSLPARDSRRFGDHWFRVIVNSLLECLDGAGDRGNVVVLGAANSVDNIDPAILRSGRLDRVLHVPLPNADALEAIFREHLPELRNADFRAVALRMLGRTGADVERVAREARRSARTAGRPVNLGDVRACLPVDSRSDDEILVATLHEAGHAVVGELLRPGALIAVSVLDSTTTGGGAIFKNSPTMQDLGLIEARMTIGLAGRAAEEVCIGRVSSGAGGSWRSDLATASAEIVRARTNLGLCGELAYRGELSIERAGRMLAENAELRAWVDERLHALYARALDLVRENECMVREVAQGLLLRDVLTGDQVRKVMANEKMLMAA